MRRGTPAWLRFFQQFNQPLVYILLMAVGVTAFLGEWMNRLFHTAPIGAESWLRIAAVATAAFAAVEFEKWIRFGGRRGEHAIPE